MIKLDECFILYTRCSVRYIGRANSILESGNFIIMRKSDGTLMIHGKKLLKPLNFQPQGVQFRQEDNKIISQRKKETIIIEIDEIYHYYCINNWSEGNLILYNTENDLRKIIIDSIKELTNDNIVEMHTEYKTKYGPVDLVAISADGLYYIIEIKRGKASLSASTQLLRYTQCFSTIPYKGLVMSPAISDNALRFLSEHQLYWKQVQFQEIPQYHLS